MDIRKALQEPLEKLNGNNVQETFRMIATNLFNNFCIQCGGKKFYFAEIEFYYYDKAVYLKAKELYKWQKVTYPRLGKSVGDFLYHLSGVDICFDSYYDNEYAKFGGILVRSIEDEDGNIITGPLTCKDFILNSCGNEMPRLKAYKPISEINPEPAKRLLGKKDMNEDIIDGKWKLCFYMKNLDWNKTSEKDVFDKEKGTIKHTSKNYSNRFQ